VAISFAEERQWYCPNCDNAIVRLTWLAIDLVERPDLRAFFTSESWTQAACPRCAFAVSRGLPLLITRLSKVAPVAMGVPDVLADAKEPPEISKPVIEWPAPQAGVDT